MATLIKQTKARHSRQTVLRGEISPSWSKSGNAPVQWAITIRSDDPESPANYLIEMSLREWEQLHTSIAKMQARLDEDDAFQKRAARSVM
jgi:hypothetical protein